MIFPASASSLNDAVVELECGKVVAFPTETVYGLGGNAYSDDAVAEIFRCKGRSATKPLSICYASFEKALDDVVPDDRALKLAEKFLPGSLTIVLKRKTSSKLSQLCSAGLETIGIRVPDHSVALDLLSRLSFPLAAPSANKSGGRSPVTAHQVLESLGFQENLMILDGGTCPAGVASTIVDLFHNRIVRIGALPVVEIKSVISIY
ncbi:MAG: threonylcarbamoyl-AMP synthase [Holosporaceae bacterium]|jgi:L-threonylcarbamoyladenylate synthase|nr:threonylcarbamoyl-AMP synthase [Holosporaceae bacterium]